MKKAEIEERLLAFQSDLLRYATYLTRESNRAEDLLQETNLRIIINHDKFDGKKFKQWSYSIMRNVFLNNCKHDDHYSVLEDMEFQYGNYQPANDNGIDSQCNVKDIYNTLNTLPVGYNIVIRLLARGLKYREIASHTESPIGTVKNRINLSRGILKQELKDFLN